MWVVSTAGSTENQHLMLTLFEALSSLFWFTAPHRVLMVLTNPKQKNIDSVTVVEITTVTSPIGLWTTISKPSLAF